MLDVGLLQELVSRRLVLFQPMTAGDIRKEYPELDRFEEFGRAKINQHEMRFVWWMSCQGSPFFDIPEADKLDACIDLSFPTDQQREARRAEYRDCRFPSKIKAAMDRMAAFNQAARAMNYVMAQRMYHQLSQNLQSAAASGDPSEYPKVAKDSMSAMAQATAMLEGLGSGITQEDDKLNEARNSAGALRRFHQNRTI